MTDEKTPPSNPNPTPNTPQAPVAETIQPTADPLKEVQEQLDDYTILLKQLQADFENYQKRIDRERTEWQQWGTKQLGLDLLSVMDSLEAGILHAKSDSEKAGLQRIAEQLKTVLLQHHIRPIDALGKKFDPLRHECITFVSDEKKADGIITTEISKGYLIHQQVLRYSRVQVNQLPPTQNNENQKTENEKLEKK